MDINFACGRRYLRYAPAESQLQRRFDGFELRSSFEWSDTPAVRERLTIGQAVRFNRKCVLSATVPRNSKGYTHAVLESGDDDKYTGAGIIREGTEAEVVDYVSHGTGTLDYPLLRILGKTAVCHTRLFDSI